MSIIRTGLPILVKLIDLVNSVITFLSQETLLTWLTFLLGSQTAILSVLLFWSISSDASICSTMGNFPPLENSDHVVISVFIDFPSYSQQDAPFHRIAGDYSRVDWDGLRDHLRDVPWEDIFKLSAPAAARELMYISLIESIKSSLSHLHGFQLLVLLP